MGTQPAIFLTRLLPTEAMTRIARLFDLSYHSRDRQLTRAEIIRGAEGKEGLICMLSDPIDREVIRRGHALRIIANYAVGTNNIDLAAATDHKIVVTNTPGVLTETTADLTWALILAVSRRLFESEAMVRSRKWKGWAPTQLLGADIYGKTLGIIGMGRIGRAVARRAMGFSMRVIYHHPRRLEPDLERELNCRQAPLEEVLAASDYLTLHVPLTDHTRHLIGKGQLHRMKPTAYLINTARGPVVDEAALIMALRSRRIAGAGLDVYEREPRIPAGLLRLKNVVLLPHLGSASTETRTRMGLMVAEDLKAFFEGRVPPHRVNPF